MSIHKKASLVGTIESLLQAVETEKAASHTEAGGYEGATSHPVGDAEDGTQSANEGERSSENSSDVKEDIQGPDVDSASDGPSDGGQDSVQSDIGITSKSTGDDPANETSSAGSGKDDPGSDHPARTDNDSLDGNKYAELRRLAKQAEAIGSDICSMIATDASIAPSYGLGEHYPSKEAAEAGYDLAGIFDGFDVSEDDKNAADAMVVDTLGEVISLAHGRAEKAAEFFNSHFNTVEKQAIEGLYDEEDTDGEDAGIEMPEEGGGDIPPELLEALMQAQGEGGEEEGLEGLEGLGGEEEGLEGLGGGGDIPPELLEALAQGGGGEGLGGEEEGVGPEEAELLEALTQGGGEDEVPGAEDALAAMGGGGEIPEEGGGDDLAMLEQVLADSGIEPEALQEALAAKEASSRINLNTPNRREKYAKMREVILELVSRSR